MVGADVLGGVRDAGQHAGLRVVARAGVAARALADGVSIHLVDLFMSSPRAEQLAGLFS